MCNRYFNFAGFIAEKVLKYDIDDTDLHILSYMYMLQASKNIVRIQVNENYYYWVTYEKIIEDNPTLKLKRRTLENRIAHLTQIGLVEKINKNFNTKKTYFSTTEKFEDLMFVTTESNSNEQNVKDIFSILPFIEEKENPKIDESTPKQVIDLYHQICTSLPKVVKLTESRKKSINARFKEGITLEMFKEAFTKAQNSNFLTGNNDRGFKADIDFLINANSLAKTLEGKYDNRKSNSNNQNKDDGKKSNNEYSDIASKFSVV